MADALRDKIRGLLKDVDFPGLVALSKEKNIARRLISMTYERGDVLSWRAMEAVGKISACLPPEEGRALIQRVLWMMREESGTNAWSAPYVLGEMLRENPGPYLDVIPVLVSFHDEEFFTAGVLWAMRRIAERHPGLIEPWAGIASEHISSREPAVRGYAALLLQGLGRPFPKEIFIGDETEIPIYGEGELRNISLCALVGEDFAAALRARSKSAPPAA